MLVLVFCCNDLRDVWVLLGSPTSADIVDVNCSSEVVGDVIAEVVTAGDDGDEDLKVLGAVDVYRTSSTSAKSQS